MIMVTVTTACVKSAGAAASVERRRRERSRRSDSRAAAPALFAQAHSREYGYFLLGVMKLLVVFGYFNKKFARKGLALSRVSHSGGETLVCLFSRMLSLCLITPTTPRVCDTQYVFTPQVDYKASSNIYKAISDATPKGVDVFFDNSYVSIAAVVAFAWSPFRGPGLFMRFCLINYSILFVVRSWG